MQEVFHFHSFTLSLIEYAAETLNGIDSLVLLRYDLDSLRCLPLSLSPHPPTPIFYTSLSQAVLQGSTAGTAPKSVAAKTVQTATTSPASVPAERASLGRAVSRVE